LIAKNIFNPILSVFSSAGCFCVREKFERKEKTCKSFSSKITRWLFFCSLKFLDEKNINACEKKVEIDNEGLERSRSFFSRNSEEM
jgi:hypothetical protein